MKQHISYSEFSKWYACPYQHKIVYVDGNKLFKGNIFTAFGTAIHKVCEDLVLDKPIKENLLEEQFVKELQSLEEPVLPEEKEIFLRQGKEIIPHVLPAAKEYFGEYDVFSTEEKLYEKIVHNNLDLCNFKGYIDLVIKKDDKYHIIDWKSCSWGWDSRKKNDKIVTYQLALYKHFFAIKHGIEPDNIETHFALLKRTSKKNRVEFFRVSSGKKRVGNAYKLLIKALNFIENKRFFKNRLSCERCEFYKTQYCT